MGIPSEEEMRRALSERAGATLCQKLSSAKVAVCGLGGLGSNIAVALARAGVGHLILVDYDCVDITNLNRQQYKVSQIGQKKSEALTDNLREVAPYMKIDAYQAKLDEDTYQDILAGADILCEAFDEAEEKSKLIHYALEHMPDKYVVAASGMAGIGSPNAIRTRQITRHFYLCGDEVSDVEISGSLFAPRVMLCAAHQAQMVIRIIAGMPEV